MEHIVNTFFKKILCYRKIFSYDANFWGKIILLK